MLDDRKRLVLAAAEAAREARATLDRAHDALKERCGEWRDVERARNAFEDAKYELLFVTLAPDPTLPPEQRIGPMGGVIRPHGR